MIALGRMGFDRGEIEAAISSVLNLSRATGTELAEPADIAVNSMRIFWLEASKMSKGSDILTAIDNGSAQTLIDFFDGLKMARPQAVVATEPFGELCAALGVMANMGVKGSLAGIVLLKTHVRTLSKLAPNQSLLRTIYTFAAQQSMLRCAPKP